MNGASRGTEGGGSGSKGIRAHTHTHHVYIAQSCVYEGGECRVYSCVRGSDCKKASRQPRPASPRPPYAKKLNHKAVEYIARNGQWSMRLGAARTASCCRHILSRRSAAPVCGTGRAAGEDAVNGIGAAHDAAGAGGLGGERWQREPPQRSRRRPSSAQERRRPTPRSRPRSPVGVWRRSASWSRSSRRSR